MKKLILMTGNPAPYCCYFGTLDGREVQIKPIGNGKAEVVAEKRGKMWVATTRPRIIEFKAP